MYIDIGTETVLGVFVHHSPGKDAETFLKANQNSIIKLKNDHVLNEQECASLLQKGTHVLKNPLDLSDIDVSLLISLARNLFTNQQLPPPKKGWKYPPGNKDKSIAADLMRLKTIRNVIVGHHPKARLPKWRFDDEWQKVSEIILRLQQQIAPGNDVHIKERIEKYRVQRLDPSVETKYDEKLKEWHKEVAEVQDQVEELVKKLQGFEAYFKTKSDRFERYTKLLLKGGHFVLSAFLSKKIEKEGRDLRSILDDNKDPLKTNIIDPKQLDILYPPANITDPLDASSWDVSLLATVILQLFVSAKDRGIKRNVKRIGDAHKNYADASLVALDSNTFEDYWTDLKASVEIVSYELDKNKADRCYQILEECKKRISEHEFQTYMDELRNQGSEMKTFTDIFKETLQKTKDLLQDMITHGINFKNGHEIELKMITLGNNEEKKELAEEILTKVWHEALDRSIQTSDFPEVKKEVLKILEEIKKSKSVKNITIKTACILLQITYTSPSDMLNIINYFESKRCHESFENISKELGYYLDTALAVYFVVPIDCLWAISNVQDESTQPTERGIRLPITVSSPAGMKHLISLCGSGEIANSTNSIADALSKHLDDTIELKTSTDMKELGKVFDADKSSSDSSSDCSATESSVINSNQLNKSDVTEKCSEGKSPGNMLEESTGQELDDKTDHLKEYHKDKTIKKETEPVTIPPDMYTAESSDPDEFDWAFPFKKRETKIQKYRNWVRAGLALHIYKVELNTIIEEAVEKQHKELIDNVKKKKGLSTVSCNKCNLQTLLPDHVQTEQKQCPLGYLNCNCLNPVGKSACPNNICGALYDHIIRLYDSTPLTPFWENPNMQRWCTDPRSIAKCFISRSGYAPKTNAFEFDVKELFLLTKSNKELLRNLYPPSFNFTFEDYEDELLQVCHYRDSLYYSNEMQLDGRTASRYSHALKCLIIAIAISIDVSKFPGDDYIVTTKDEALVHADVISALGEEAKYLEQKLSSCEETNLSEKGIEDEDVPVKKRRFDDEESKVERLEPRSSGQEVPAKKRRLDSTKYGHTYAINMPTEPEAGQDPRTPYRTDHTTEGIEDYKTQLEKIKTLISVHKEKMVYIDSKIVLSLQHINAYNHKDRELVDIYSNRSVECTQRMSDKYYRLITFVVNICPRPLRELFIAKAKADTNHLYTSLEDYLLFWKPDIDKLRRRFKISLDQFANIYPAVGSVDIQTWDVTLLAVLLTQLFSNQLKQNERDCLRDITDIRNSLQHIANTDIIDDQKFNTAWSGLRDAVLTLSKCTGSPSLNNIEDEIKSALTEGMPNLVDVIRTWNQVLCMQLQLHNSELANEIKTLKEESRKSSKILTKASVKRKGRSGMAEKRMKIVDNKVERMKEKLAKALTEENDCIESFKNDIALITQQLIENHRVIVTGHNNMLTYKCALAAVNQRNYQRTDQCLEINNPSDWKRISPEDAQFVLFREPFGRSTYDLQKVETMLEEFDSMLDATNDENDEVIDIIIVTNLRLLNDVARQNEHDMLAPASTVYIDSTLGNTPEEVCATEDPVYRNLLENSRIHRQSYATKPVNKKVKAEAENMFIDYSAVAIVGSAGSGKTSLSFELLPKYDLSNGEENFLVLMDPGELKYVNFSLRPVIIIKPLAGMDFDKVEASKWYRQFGRLFSAVQEKKAAVIIIMETEVFRMWEAHMRTHPLLDHVVYMEGNRAKEMEKHKPDNVQNGLQTEKTSPYDEIPNSASRDVIRYVKSVRDYDIESEGICNIMGCCVLPTGNILLADYANNKITKTDRYYSDFNTCDLPELPRDVCYIDSNVAVVALRGQKLQFVDVTEGLTLTKSVNTDHACRAVACHGNKLYVIDDDSVYVYTTDGEYQNVLYTAEFDEDDYDFNNVAVSNDGRMIYITDNYNGLVTIDSSGYHLYTLIDLPGYMGMKGVCVDDQGYVYVLCSGGADCVIVQVSTDGRQNLGTVLELNGDYGSIQFDRMKSALLVAGTSDKLRVLTLKHV